MWLGASSDQSALPGDQIHVPAIGPDITQVQNVIDRRVMVRIRIKPRPTKGRSQFRGVIAMMWSNRDDSAQAGSRVMAKDDLLVRSAGQRAAQRAARWLSPTVCLVAGITGRLDR